MFSQSVRPKMPDGAKRSGPAHRKSTTTAGRIAPAVAGALLAAALSPLAAVPANAETAGMGPVDSTGFPTWYSDGTVRLQLCYEAGKGCLSEPPDPNSPASYPGNFPEEAFWFAASADVGTIGSYEAALEAAHVNGPVVPGEQMGFARLRFRFDGLRPNAQYTVTHPYGVDTFTADAAGGINSTTDAGACAPTDTVACDWAGVGAAFLGDFGRGTTASFLRQVNAPAGTLGDINTAGPVTGAPSGSNSVTVAGPDAGGPGVNTVTQSNFTVQGLIATDSVGGPNTPDLAAASDSGRSNSDNITNVTAPTITGTLPAGTAGPVQLIVDNGAPRATTLTGSTYSLKLAPLAQGRHTVQAVAGGLNSGTLNFTVDTTAPAVAVTAPFPSTPSLDTTPTLSYSGEAGARFECQLLPSNPSWDPTCTSPKTWDAQANGTHVFNVRATDAAGNVSLPASRMVRVGLGGSGGLRDFNSDGKADVVSRDSGGRLWLYPGNGGSGFLARTQIGVGWNSMSSIVSVGDFNNDAKSDLVARDSSGRLWLYPGNGAGGVQARIQLGAGWNSMTSIVGAGDLNRDGKVDLTARDSSGRLWLYKGNGSNGFLPRTQIGTGWNVMTSIAGPGDLNSDGRADLVARDSSGKFWLYRGNGTGGVLGRTQIGSGWNIYSSVVGSGDLNGDGRADLTARDSSGRLWFYAGNGTGGVLGRTQIGASWQVMTSIS
ncbi:FG-GAP-like repeat-containing protein [Arthrobacter sp. ISL-65]|uniref:FG-GAP-like repeat-containing protein n=1 Tax=Arthrobacter sp. ISL-65 TaxID=2819112 RepID=UPI001BE74F0E|nr:FG-GAP-like repeat-containing protein [Arthrobacter sp. ISL-65]MBT2547132.1 VCBS repeat-containing protein [Arthrobacter sp. ISL-65]